jgi:hypothetical protein
MHVDCGVIEDPTPGGRLSFFYQICSVFNALFSHAANTVHCTALLYSFANAVPVLLPLYKVIFIPKTELNTDIYMFIT